MQNEQLLQKINSPADLKMLTLDEMKLLAGVRTSFRRCGNIKACQDSRSVKKASTMLLVQDIPAHPSQLLWGWL